MAASSRRAWRNLPHDHGAWMSLDTHPALSSPASRGNRPILVNPTPAIKQTRESARADDPGTNAKCCSLRRLTINHWRLLGGPLYADHDHARPIPRDEDEKNEQGQSPARYSS